MLQFYTASFVTFNGNAFTDLPAPAAANILREHNVAAFAVLWAWVASNIWKLEGRRCLALEMQ